jgi:hypothetical protein
MEISEEVLGIGVFYVLNKMMPCPHFILIV